MAEAKGRVAKCRVVCAGCGAVGVGSSPEEAWSRVPHEGHGHRGEELAWAEAEAEGQGVEV
jgi:hypothetical protein